MLRFLHVVPFLLMLAVFGCTQGPGASAEEPLSSGTDWRGIAVTDVSTGESFSISDFKGKVVVLETMAVWCPTCVRQQIEIQALRDRFGDQVGSITLDIDRNEGQDILRRHVQTYGFEERFAVSPIALTRALEKDFGTIVLNATSTPVIIVDRQQQGHLLRPGLKSAAELAKELEKHL